MIIDLISYSLDQNHQDFVLKKVEKNLLYLNHIKKKYIIYCDFLSLGNKDEIKIQLPVFIKHKLI